jgi:hypothetical protein
MADGVLKIDDVNLVAMAKNVRGHPRIPKAGLVAEMNSGLKHFTHTD